MPATWQEPSVPMKKLAKPPEEAFALFGIDAEVFRMRQLYALAHLRLAA